MKGIITWPAITKLQKKLTKLVSSDTALNGWRIELVKVDPPRKVVALLIQQWRKPQQSNRILTAEGQIQAARRNIVLLMFFTFTLCLLYTGFVMIELHK